MKKSTHLLRVAMLVTAYLTSAPALEVSVSGQTGFGVTYVQNVADQSTLEQAVFQGGMQDCFLETISIGSVRTCDLNEPPYVMACITMRNNVLGNMLESAGMRNHYALKTIASEIYLEWAAPASAPTNKKAGGDQQSGNAGGSSRGMSRTLARPTVFSTIKSLVTHISLETLCDVQMPEGGSYLFYAEGDEEDSGDSVWRAIISPYYESEITCGISLLATAIETAGFCPLDIDFIVCFGGWGAKYPTSGLFPAKSPALHGITAMWRAQEIHAAPAGTYGIYDTSLGFAVHSQFHNTEACIVGASANLAPYSPGSYMQWIHPGVQASPSTQEQDNCSILGVGPGTSMQVATQILGEMISKTWIEDSALSFIYWPRFVCCNWCHLFGATDDSAQHYMPEESYDPTLTRKP